MEEDTADSEPPGFGKRRTRSAKVFGPVIDPEQYVRSDWWRHLFNSTYLKTDGDVVEDPRITRIEVDFFSRVLGLKQNQKILDLCCGQGRHTLELARRGYVNLEGLDRSHYLVQTARMRASRENLKVRFREGDARKLPYAADAFDAVMILGNSFGYFARMDDDMMVIRECARVLRNHGTLLIDIADGEFVERTYQPRTWEWIDRRHFVCRERYLSHDKERLVSREIVNDVGRGVVTDQFYAERIYTREKLAALLRTLGFDLVTVHGELTPDSARNQDLGMMARRVVMTGQVVKNTVVPSDELTHAISDRY